jgi:hypothetical protein
LTFVFKHPNYYKNLATNCRRDNKSQRKEEDEEASSKKQQAIDETVPYNDIEEAQASSNKRQAPEQDSD